MKARRELLYLPFLSYKKLRVRARARPEASRLLPLPTAPPPRPRSHAARLGYHAANRRALSRGAHAVPAPYVVLCLCGPPSAFGPRPPSSKRWKFTTGGSVFSSPTVSANQQTVYVGSQDHNLYALNANDGTERWRFAAGGGGVLCPGAQRVPEDGACRVAGQQPLRHQRRRRRRTRAPRQWFLNHQSREGVLVAQPTKS